MRKKRSGLQKEKSIFNKKNEHNATAHKSVTVTKFN